MITKSYIGNWYYWDENQLKLIAMPSIKRKMVLPEIYLLNFSDRIIEDYTDCCSIIFEKEKVRIESAKR